ncbi:MULTISPECIES: Gfo/Idh/MocA family protein [Bacillaceae]|uniref:Oxidoreductase n=1 Tax=Alkalicoccobacillus plakortidis TaxID=444060 RepID=A0A9D5I0W8_9BACI|nr:MULTISPECIES: Gfo/Idh/MocA family oxidoreductase [Bacillaceae]KQL57070.1 oxidoreductase [Alkalicoccobacillus plakortidis]
MNTYNWGILGLGSIAADFAHAITAYHGELYAVASRSAEKAEAFASEHGATKAYSHYTSLMTDPKVDIIYVATPHASHHEYIREALQNGKHVLCEKAITINGDELNELIELAEKNNLILMEAMTIYHMPLYHALRDVITSNRLGPVKMINVTFGSRKPFDPSNRFYNPELAGGALLDIGTYALSFARFFLSEQPTQVLTTMKATETNVDEQSAIVLKTSTDEIVTISLAFRGKMPKRGIIACENGFITVDDFPRAEQATLTWHDGNTEVIKAGHSAEALMNEIKAMESSVSGIDQSYISISKDVMTLMDEVSQQWSLQRTS